MTESWKILLVEDDENLAYLLGEHLSKNNFIPVVCGRADKAIKKFKEEKFHLLILDVVLPDMDGISLAREIRKTDDVVPIVFLTSRNLKSDKLLGYEVGADDYITKPFDADLLTLKINALLNRSYNKANAEVTMLDIGPYKLDTGKRKFISVKEEIKLSGTECAILKTLVMANGNSVSREDIMKEVWGKSDFFISKSLDVYITRIRKILKDKKEVTLETIHSFGYSLNF